MAVAINMRVQWSWMKEYHLGSFHWVVLREINLELIHFISIEGSRSSIYFNHPPLEILGDFVFKANGGIDLPLHQLLLKPIASNLTQCLASGGGGTGHGEKLSEDLEFGRVKEE